MKVSRSPRIALGLGLGLCLAAEMAVAAGWVGAPLAIHLLTDNGDPPIAGCYTNWAEGPLVVDPRFGTAIIDRDMNSSSPVPVMWRAGFTARLVGDQVEVRDPGGNVVATTGHAYRIAGGGYSHRTPDGSVVSAFWACDRATPLANGD